MDSCGLIVLAGSSGSYRMDRIVWIILVLVLGSLVETGFYALASLLLAGWYGLTGWDVGGLGVRWRYQR